MNICIQYIYVCVHVCANLGAIDCGQEHSKKKKKSTQTSIPRSVQGAIFHTKESFEERKEKGRKKKQISKCAIKKRRLKAPLFSPFFLAPFFAAIERDRMIVRRNRGGRRVAE